MTYTYDSRWSAIARDWLTDCDLPDQLVTKYTPALAQRLHDTAEDVVTYEIPDLERDAEDAARDAHEQRQLDEASGK